MEDKNIIKRHRIILSKKISENNQAIERNENSLKNYQYSDLPLEFRERNITQIEKRIESFLTEKNNLEFRLKLVNQGKADPELSAVENTQVNRPGEKIQEPDKLESQKKKYRDCIKEEYDDGKRVKTQRYEMKKEYYHFHRVIDGAPDYLLKNLQTMPMNKGYKFKGVIFWGDLPQEGEEYVVFERLDKNTLHIHIWDKDTISLYEKKGKEPKVLLEQTSRKKLNNRNWLADYF